MNAMTNLSGISVKFIIAIVCAIMLKAMKCNTRSVTKGQECYQPPRKQMLNIIKYNRKKKSRGSMERGSVEAWKRGNVKAWKAYYIWLIAFFSSLLSSQR
jgi:hypothetical protein